MNLVKRFLLLTSVVIGILLAWTPMLAQSIGEEQTYPSFQIGVSGAWVTIEPGIVMKVERIEQASPADGELEAGDIILEANGKPIKGKDARVPLGKAVTEAEATDGLLQLTIERGGQQAKVDVRLPKLGAYSDTWPLDCDKSKTIIEAHAAYLVGLQNEQGWFAEKRTGHLNQCLSALFLLSTDEPAYAENVKRFAHALADSVEKKPTGSVWHLGYHLIFLAEYYLKTGDKQVLPAIEVGCKTAAANQVAGGWGHYLYPEGMSMGYVQGGLMNSAGVTLFLGMTLARECGVNAQEEAFRRSLDLFYRNVGHGSICYGDHRAELRMAANGRNAAVASAFHVIGQEPYTTAGQHLAMMVADSYFLHESGHTGGGFNMLWRGMAMPLLPADQQGRVRRHMEALSWYYDLCRHPNGGFSLLPSPPKTTLYVGQEWGQGMGLTYTAPLKSLRITGGPPTKYSRQTPKLPSLLWGTERDKVFFETTHANGFGSDTESPHETFARLSDLSDGEADAGYCGKMLRHYNSAIRTMAGRKLAQLKSDEAYDHIEAALQDPDPRVRRAACDGISGYENWGRRGWASVPREVVTKQFVPHIEKILNDSESAFWEIDGALWAIKNSQPVDIRRNLKNIDAFAHHEEWYLRESAFWAIVGLGKDISGDEFLALADYYNNARHVFERGSMNGGVNELIKELRGDLKPEQVEEFVKKIVPQTYDAATVAGYDEMAARHNAAHRTMMVIASFKDPPFKLIVADLVKYMEGWKPGNQHSNWLITGDKWQPGLAKIANDLGKDAEPIIREFESCLKQDYWDPNDKNHFAVREAMQEAIDNW